MAPKTFILVLSCDDKPGIVAAVTTELAALGANIAESNQFWDTKTHSCFMRIAGQVEASV
ncbi:MAG: ACT domain-containing protein, partial [Ensifer adhaerens]|nr:ACT domain-containing protein [Ensifer adhaerens]